MAPALAMQGGAWPTYGRQYNVIQSPVVANAYSFGGNTHTHSTHINAQLRPLNNAVAVGGGGGGHAHSNAVNTHNTPLHNTHTTHTPAPAPGPAPPLFSPRGVPRTAQPHQPLHLHRPAFSAAVHTSSNTHNTTTNTTTLPLVSPRFVPAARRWGTPPTLPVQNTPMPTHTTLQNTPTMPMQNTLQNTPTVPTHITPTTVVPPTTTMQETILSPTALSTGLHSHAPTALLPPAAAHHGKRYVVVFDLDETLVFARSGPVVPRPGCHSVLRTLKRYEHVAETVVWTAGEKWYASAAIAQIDADNSVAHIVPRCVSWCNGPGAVKDMKRLGRDLASCLLIENTADCVRENQDRAILLPDFTATSQETGDLMAVLESVLSSLVTSGIPVPTFLASCPLLHKTSVPCSQGGLVMVFVITGFEPHNSASKIEELVEASPPQPTVTVTPRLPYSFLSAK